MASLGITEGNITERKKKKLNPTDYEPSGNSPSGEAAQMTAPATNKWELSWEVRSALLRVKIWPECPEGSLSELTWASKSDCGITTKQKASPNLRHHQTRTQNKGLNRDSWLQTISLW